MATEKEPGQERPLPSHYANMLRISQSPFEFVLDFGVISPEKPSEASLASRIILSPQIAKAVMKAIVTQIKKYEERYGKISWPPEGPEAEDILKEFDLG